MEFQRKSVLRTFEKELLSSVTENKRQKTENPKIIEWIPNWRKRQRYKANDCIVPKNQNKTMSTSRNRDKANNSDWLNISYYINTHTQEKNVSSCSSVLYVSSGVSPNLSKTVKIIAIVSIELRVRATQHAFSALTIAYRTILEIAKCFIVGVSET